jgi:hypothetical protein
MAVENPTWGAPRIHGELHMLGFDVVRAYPIPRLELHLDSADQHDIAGLGATR